MLIFFVKQPGDSNDLTPAAIMSRIFPPQEREEEEEEGHSLERPDTCNDCLYEGMDCLKFDTNEHMKCAAIINTEKVDKKEELTP